MANRGDEGTRTPPNPSAHEQPRPSTSSSNQGTAASEDDCIILQEIKAPGEASSECTLFLEDPDVKPSEEQLQEWSRRVHTLKRKSSQCPEAGGQQSSQPLDRVTSTSPPAGPTRPKRREMEEECQQLRRELEQVRNLLLQQQQALQATAQPAEAPPAAPVQEAVQLNQVPPPPPPPPQQQQQQQEEEEVAMEEGGDDQVHIVRPISPDRIEWAPQNQDDHNAFDNILNRVAQEVPVAPVEPLNEGVAQWILDMANTMEQSDLFPARPSYPRRIRPVFQWNVFSDRVLVVHSLAALTQQKRLRSLETLRQLKRSNVILNTVPEASDLLTRLQQLCRVPMEPLLFAYLGITPESTEAARTTVRTLINRLRTQVLDLSEVEALGLGHMVRIVQGVHANHINREQQRAPLQNPPIAQACLPPPPAAAAPAAAPEQEPARPMQQASGCIGSQHPPRRTLGLVAFKNPEARAKYGH